MMMRRRRKRGLCSSLENEVQLCIWFQKWLTLKLCEDVSKGGLAKALRLLFKESFHITHQSPLLNIWHEVKLPLYAHRASRALFQREVSDFWLTLYHRKERKSERSSGIM